MFEYDGRDGEYYMFSNNELAVDVLFIKDAANFAKLRIVDLKGRHDMQTLTSTISNLPEELRRFVESAQEWRKKEQDEKRRADIAAMKAMTQMAALDEVQFP